MTLLPHAGRQLAFASALLLLLLTALPRPAAASSVDRLRASVVKIYVTIQRYDYSQPWQAMPLGSGNGSGFLISKRRILTNAHVVSDAAFIEVQRDGDPRRFPAHVAFIGHDCDLAIVIADDPAFYEGAQESTFNDSLPRLNDEVMCLGFPMGGVRLSLTRGVVSRIDNGTYVHSGVDSHLVVQTDAAINPGNSGGPVLLHGHVIGVAFQGIASSQNIGYTIPLPVINHFLLDIEKDAVYHGYPELGVMDLDTRNPALRRSLGLPAASAGGPVVTWLDPFGAGHGLLYPGDVLMRVNDREIARDGSIVMDGNTVEYTEQIERGQWGDQVAFDISRSGAVQRITVPLRNPQDPFTLRMRYGEPPEYVIVGGLVFTPLTRNLLGTLGSEISKRAVHNLFYVSQYAKLDGLYEGRSQFVVLANRLPHPVNTYDDAFRYGIIATVNGRRLAALRDLPEALTHPLNGFHVITFEGIENPLVLDTGLLQEADAQIQRRYEIPALSRLRKQEAQAAGY